MMVVEVFGKDEPTSYHPTILCLPILKTHPCLARISSGSLLALSSLAFFHSIMIDMFIVGNTALGRQSQARYRSHGGFGFGGETRGYEMLAKYNSPGPGAHII